MQDSLKKLNHKTDGYEQSLVKKENLQGQ